MKISWFLILILLVGVVVGEETTGIHTGDSVVLKVDVRGEPDFATSYSLDLASGTVTKTSFLGSIGDPIKISNAVNNPDFKEAKFALDKLKELKTEQERINAIYELVETVPDNLQDYDSYNRDDPYQFYVDRTRVTERDAIASAALKKIKEAEEALAAPAAVTADTTAPAAAAGNDEIHVASPQPINSDTIDLNGKDLRAFDGNHVLEGDLTIGGINYKYDPNTGKHFRYDDYSFLPNEDMAPVGLNKIFTKSGTYYVNGDFVYVNVDAKKDIYVYDRGSYKYTETKTSGKTKRTNQMLVFDAEGKASWENLEKGVNKDSKDNIIAIVDGSFVNIAGNSGWKDQFGVSVRGDKITIDKNKYLLANGVNGKAVALVKDKNGKWCDPSHTNNCGAGYYSSCSDDSKCIGDSVCKDALLWGKFCVPSDYANQYDRNKNDFVGRIQNAANWANTGSEVSNLLFGDEAFEDWKIAHDNFFSNTVIGQLSSGKWEDMLCGLDVDSGDDQTVIVDVGDMMNFGMHIEADVMYGLPSDDGYLDNLFKVSYYVFNTNEEDEISFNLAFYDVFEGSERMTYYYNEWKVVGEESSYSGTGANMIVDNSSRNFFKVCLVLSDDICDYEGNEKDHVCNLVSNYNGAGTAYGSSGSSSSSVTGGGVVNANWY